MTSLKLVRYVSHAACLMMLERTLKFFGTILKFLLLISSYKSFSLVALSSDNILFDVLVYIMCIYAIYNVYNWLFIFIPELKTTLKDVDNSGNNTRLIQT